VHLVGILFNIIVADARNHEPEKVIEGAEVNEAKGNRFFDEPGMFGR
jgi:hypothetical protein